jgi:hypothetical protein
MAIQQIPQNNISFAKQNTDFTNVANAYGKYMDEVIRKHEQNKTIFEQIQLTSKLAKPGNGSDNDAQVYNEVNQKFGQRIKALSESGNGVNGYAGLSKQVDQLQLDIRTDSGYIALQESYNHAQKIGAEVFGQTENEQVDAKGNRSTVKRDNYPGWSNDEKRVAVNMAIKNSGVKKVKQQDGTEKYEFQGVSVDLPEAIDKETYFREKFTKEIQSYETQYGMEYTNVDVGLQSIDRQSKQGKDWKGINNAISIAMETDEKYNNYLKKKAEISHYNFDTGKVEFSLNAEKNNDLEANLTETARLFGSSGENMEQFLLQLKTKSVDDYNKFIKDNNIKDNDTPYQKLLKVNSRVSEKIEDNYNQKIKDQLSYFQTDLETNLITNEEKSQQLEKLDFDLGKKAVVDKMRQNDLSIIGNQNKSIYGKLSTAYIHIAMNDQDARRRAAKKDEEDSEKYRVAISRGLQLPIDYTGVITKRSKDLNVQSAEIKNKLSNILKQKYNYDGTVPIYQFIKDKKLAANEDITDIYQQSIEQDQQIANNNIELDNIRPTLQTIPKEKLGNVRELVEQGKINPLRGFVNSIKATFGNNYPGDILNQAINQTESQFIETQKQYARQNNLPIPSNDKISDVYYTSLEQASDIAKKNNINTYNSTGSIIFDKLNDNDQEVLEDKVMSAFTGLTPVTFIGGDLPNATTLNDKNLKDAVKSLYKPDGTLDRSRVNVKLIQGADHRSKVVTTIDGSTFIADLTGSDVDKEVKNLGIQGLAKSLNERSDYIKSKGTSYRSQSMNPEVVANQADQMYGLLATTMVVNKVIPDENQKDITLKSKSYISDLSNEVTNLKIGSYTTISTENGVILRFGKVNSKKGNTGNIVVEAKDPKTGTWKNVTSTKDNIKGRSFENFESILPELGRSVGKYGNGTGGEYMSMYNWINQLQ